MAVRLRPGSGGSQPDELCCDVCGRTQILDPTLPYVSQAASFAVDHFCGQFTDDGPGQC